jgi:hypothetical protein
MMTCQIVPHINAAPTATTTETTIRKSNARLAMLTS